MWSQIEFSVNCRKSAVFTTSPFLRYKYSGKEPLVTCTAVIGLIVTYRNDSVFVSVLNCSIEVLSPQTKNKIRHVSKWLFSTISETFKQLVRQNWQLEEITPTM